MGDIEVANCDICKVKEKQVSRTYYRYAIQCDCCNTKADNHFEIILTCKDCEPVPPKKIIVVLKPVRR